MRYAWDLEELCLEAANPKTEPSRLKDLAQQGDDLALLVAQNPNTSAELLGELSKTKGLLVFAVLRNPSIPLSLLEALSTHKKRCIRRAVAECLKTPIPIRQRLCQDPWVKIRLAALKIEK